MVTMTGPGMPGEAADYKVDKFLVITNYPAAGGVSASGSAYINKGELLFKFYSFHDDVRIGVRLVDSGGVPRLLDIETEVEVERNGGEYFILFLDFPPGYTRDNVHCYFELRLTNMTPKRKDVGTAINVQLLFRP
jgi:hypothetical protein